MKFTYLIAAILLAAPAWSAVVYEQPPSHPAGSPCPCWTSTYGADLAGGYETFDDFQLASAANINIVSWQGLYLDFITGSNNPVGPQTTSWTIHFRAGSGGLPGAFLYSQTLLASDVDT